ncbi:hypothetical protein ACQP1V_28880 [Microtetraspora malaysiensis]
MVRSDVAGRRLPPHPAANTTGIAAISAVAVLLSNEIMPSAGS